MTQPAPQTSEPSQEKNSLDYLPLVYDELRRLALAKMLQEKAGQTLSPTALVHEAYLRLFDAPQPRHFSNQAHFFASAARAMNRILVENARRRRTTRHGGTHKRCELSEGTIPARESAVETEIVRDAVAELKRHDPLLARLVQLRYFDGLSIDEASTALGVSVRTTHRQWTKAKAWLKQTIS